MPKFRLRPFRTSQNISKSDGADIQEYLLIIILILLVVGVLIAHFTHRLIP